VDVWYIAKRTDLKPRTRSNLEQARRKLVEFFGPARNLRGLTRGDAGDWRRSLKLSRATVSTHVKKAKQFFADAVDRKLLAENPFAGLKAGKQANEARMRYVPVADIRRVIDKCPTPEWKLLFALARFGGLRVPSESELLEWTDIDWKRGRMTVRSPKTEHHEGRGSRLVPLFPELVPFLQDAQAAAGPGARHVLARLQDRQPQNDGGEDRRPRQARGMAQAVPEPAVILPDGLERKASAARRLRVAGEHGGHRPQALPAGDRGRL
jgi:integrase